MALKDHELEVETKAGDKAVVSCDYYSARKGDFKALTDAGKKKLEAHDKAKMERQKQKDKMLKEELNDKSE